MGSKRKNIMASAIFSLCLLLIVMFSQQIWRDTETRKAAFFPNEINDVLVNPYKGFAADARDPGQVKTPVTLVHLNVYWKDLEPVKGEFQFDWIEQHGHFEEWRARNARFVLRFIMDDPNEEGISTIPDWLYKEIEESGTWYDLSYGKGFSPNYSHPYLIQRHERVIEALAQRYDHDPIIAFIQIGSIGHWGEWHTAKIDGEAIPFPTEKVSDQYVKHYLNAFHEKKMLMRRPHQIALDHNLGLFNDSFGLEEGTIDEFLNWINHGYISWLTQEQMPAMPEYWKTAPGGGEFSTVFAAEEYLTNERFESVLRQLRLTHPSWLGPNAPVYKSLNQEAQHNLDRLLNTIGYHFVVRSVSHEEFIASGQVLQMDFEWENKGVAPFYFKWPVEVSLVNDQGEVVHAKLLKEDIRKWMPGTASFRADLDIPESLEAGTYRIAVAILDPEREEAGIQLGIEGRREDGRYELSRIQIQ